MAKKLIMEHRQVGHRYENDGDMEQIIKWHESLNPVTTIPVKIEIAGKGQVLSLDNAKKYLVDAEKLVLSDCICRANKHNCDAPVRVCLTINDNAEWLLTSEETACFHPHTSSVDEAMHVLGKSHRAGLVHMAFAGQKDRAPDKLTAICSCCSCCCETLKSVVRFGLSRDVIVSDTVSETDFVACTACGTCVHRCQFGARCIVNEELLVVRERCVGCGLCVGTCPEAAINLVAKD